MASILSVGGVGGAHPPASCVMRRPPFGKEEPSVSPCQRRRRPSVLFSPGLAPHASGLCRGEKKREGGEEKRRRGDGDMREKRRKGEGETEEKRRDGGRGGGHLYEKRR